MFFLDSMQALAKKERNTAKQNSARRKNQAKWHFSASWEKCILSRILATRLKMRKQPPPQKRKAWNSQERECRDPVGLVTSGQEEAWLDVPPTLGYSKWLRQKWDTHEQLNPDPWPDCVQDSSRKTILETTFLLSLVKVSDTDLRIFFFLKWPCYLVAHNMQMILKDDLNVNDNNRFSFVYSYILFWKDFFLRIMCTCVSV